MATREDMGVCHFHDQWDRVWDIIIIDNRI